MEALLWRRAVAGPVRPRGTPMTSRHGDPVGARLRQFYAALIDERRLGARRSFHEFIFKPKYAGKGAFDRVRGPQVFPVFGGEIVECEQGLAIFCQTLGSLLVF